MKRERTKAGKQGFTLIEVLAALAIASVIILATAALMHQVVLAFDRGTNRVSGADRLAHAVERLASDIASARFVLERDPAGAFAAFVGAPAQITFIGAGGINPGLGRSLSAPPPEEIVSVTVETADDVTQIVRRRALRLSPRMRLDEALLGDPVVLVAGRFDAAFAFARLGPEGGLSWNGTWTRERLLPRLVKLALRDRASGIDLLGGAEFLVRADAPIACARAGAGANCMTGTNDAAPQPRTPAAPQRIRP
jgi:prepilin-type N-terminal cleavage/methylation domain-containing protein